MLRQIGLCPSPQVWKAILSILLSPWRAQRPPSCPCLVCCEPTPLLAEGGLSQPCCSAHPPPSMEFFQPSNLVLQHLSLQEGSPQAPTPPRLNPTGVWPFLERGILLILLEARRDPGLGSGDEGFGACTSGAVKLSRAHVPKGRI